MSIYDDMNQLDELSRAREWFWNWPDAEIVKDERGQWRVRWSQQFKSGGVIYDYAKGNTKQEALLAAYRKAQDMEVAE